MDPVCIECGARKPEAFGPYVEADSPLCLECAAKLLGHVDTEEEKRVCANCGDDLDPDGFHMCGSDCGDDLGVIEI